MFRIAMILCCVLGLGLLLMAPLCTASPPERSDIAVVSQDINPSFVGSVTTLPPPTPDLPSVTEPKRTWNVGEQPFSSGGKSFRYQKGQLQVHQLTCAPGARTCQSTWVQATPIQQQQVRRAFLFGGRRTFNRRP
jgi:hypothetical protein